MRLRPRVESNSYSKSYRVVVVGAAVEEEEEEAAAGWVREDCRSMVTLMVLSCAVSVAWQGCGWR